MAVHRIRVMVVDDARRVRKSLRQRLDLEGDIEVVGEAADGEEAVALAAALQPDVILLDLDLPPRDGFTTARQIKAGTFRGAVLALTIHSFATHGQEAGAAGMDGFIEKGQAPEALLTSIRRAHQEKVNG